jgi:hypothetical protein
MEREGIQQLGQPGLDEPLFYFANLGVLCGEISFTGQTQFS